jgi:DnaK suppressor protein
MYLDENREVGMPQAKGTKVIKKGKSKPGGSSVEGVSSSAKKETLIASKGNSRANPAGKTIPNLSVTEVNVKANKKQDDLSPREEAIQKIKMRLLQQKGALLSGAESALNELPGQTIFPDLGDQATAETDRNFMLRLRGREQRLLKKIEEAIERIDNGTFGICDDCGNEIDIKRLDARPVTTMCIECKTLQEEEEKLRET